MLSKQRREGIQVDSATKEKLVANGIDCSEGIDRFGGNEAMYEKFIRRFLEDNHLKALQSALDAKDAETAFYHAHTLKGVVGNLSFGAYFVAISMISGLLHDGRINEAIAHMPKVEEAHTKVVRALEKL